MSRQIDIPGREGLAAIRIVRAIYKSASTGRTVELEPVSGQVRPDYDQAIFRPGFEKPDEINTSGPEEKS